MSLPHTLPWHDWVHLRFSLEWIYDGPIEAVYRETRGHIPGQSAFLLRSGTVEISGEGETMTAAPGQWLLLNEGLRRQTFSPDASMLSIRFHWTWPGGQPLFNWKLATFLLASEVPELETAACRLERCVRKRYGDAGIWLRMAPGDLESYLEVESLLMSWLRLYATALLARGHSPSRFEVADERMLRAIWILDHHPLDQPLPEARLAAEVNLSVGQFGRLFTQQFGVSPFRYLERRRLAEATACVRTSDASLKVIAIDLGFRSLSHFSSWFKRRTGWSPTDFRHNY